MNTTAEDLNKDHGLSSFFNLLNAVPIIAGVLMLLLTPFLKKRMHGIH